VLSSSQSQKVSEKFQSEKNRTPPETGEEVVKKRQDGKNLPPSPTEEEVELLRFIDNSPEVLKSQYYKKKAEP